jgi:hypothetical protein
MKTYTGIVTGQSIEKNRDSENNVRMLQLELTEPGDVQGAQLMTFSGDDNSPPEGTKVTIIEISPSYKIAVASEDQIEPSVATGERKLYSQKNNAIEAFIYLKNDGKIQLNGTGDNAVRFKALETAFNELQGKWNAFAAAYVPGGPTVVGLPPSAGSSTGDISLAKIDELEVAP